MILKYLANGNISNWKQQNRGFALQNYAYAYDNLQRITNATDGTFHQAYSYKDALGNFNGIFRNDLVKTNGNWAIQNIDDNAYFYQNPLSSKISSILDYTGSQLGYKANSGTYTYDANGNTTYDPANKISTVYNYLNLPSKFTKDDGTRQELVYDFSGKKWQENEYLANSNLLSKRSYLGSFEFEGNSLQKVFHSSGFIQNLAADVSSGGQTNGNITGSNIVSTQKLKSGVKSEYIADKSICLLPGFESLPVFNAEIKPLVGFQWNYILKDHLGNTRVLFADKNGDGLIKQDTDNVQNEILSLSNYSPFGLELGGSHQNLKQQFDLKFNGKQDNGFSGLTDFGARWFDKNSAVWGQVDPHGEKYNLVSLYSFGFSNPARFIDINGNDPGDVLVAFGGADLLNNNGKGIATNIIEQLHNNYIGKSGGKAEAFSSQYWGVDIENAETLDKATQKAYDFVLTNYNKENGKSVKGGKIIIEGYSFGGVLANHLAKRLSKDKLKVDLLLTVDAAAGPESENVDRTISSNTSKNINLYQSTPSILDSRGDKNIKEKGNNYSKIYNIDLTKITNEHGKIDDISLKAVVNQILKELNNR